MVSAALPLITFETATDNSVQIAPLRSTTAVESTVPVTMTGDLAMSCSSVGMTIVVALAAAAAIIKTHVIPYTRKLFMKVSEVIRRNGTWKRTDSPRDGL